MPRLLPVINTVLGHNILQALSSPFCAVCILGSRLRYLIDLDRQNVCTVVLHNLRLNQIW